MKPHTLLFTVLCVKSLLFTLTSTATVPLEVATMDGILKNTDFVFVNFYADWCRFSQMLKPIFEETAKILNGEFTDDVVKLGTVDCDKQTKIAEKYHVSKYPTLKMFRNGEVMKKEYRGQRSADALAKFVKDQIVDPIKRVANIDELDEIERKKGSVIGYFDGEDNEDFKSFRTVSGILRDDCIFYAALGEMSSSERFAGNKVIFRPVGDKAENNDIPYSGLLKDKDILKAWGVDKCVPLVREITFENAEELTEEGIPFLILFRDPNDKETYDRYKAIVQKELMGEKSSVNFLVADGFKFSHPLYHLGKKSEDLPVLAIDSFRHMYVFPKDTKDFIDVSGELKSFIADLHSGKLHREFHHGPEKAKAQEQGSQDADHMHVQVQQQLIMSADGTPITIVKVVQTPHDKDHKPTIRDVGNHIGHENPMEALSEELAKIAEPHLAPEDESKKENSTDPDAKDPLAGIAHRINDDNQEKVFDEIKKAVTFRPDDSVVVKDEVVTVKVKKTEAPNIVSEDVSDPPKSVFQKLAPSEDKYSFKRRDEL